MAAVNHNGITKRKKCFIIGVAGGTASGKTTVCRCIIENLGENDKETCSRRVVIVSQDSFYKPLTKEEIALAHKGMYNFDHPNAFDTDLMMDKLSQIRKGEMVELPIYDFLGHCRSSETYSVYPTDIVLVEGILVLYYAELRNLMDMKLFVDTDSDTRLSRRVVRDIESRGRQLDHVLQQYTSFVKPAFEEFCLPTKKYADVIIPRGGENTVAIGLIVQHIRDLLSGVEMFKSSNAVKTTTLH